MKSEAGRDFVSLSLDLGHVHSEQDLSPRGGPRNGPARSRRHEKHAAARKKLATEEAIENVELTANVDYYTLRYDDLVILTFNLVSQMKLPNSKDEVNF